MKIMVDGKRMEVSVIKIFKEVEPLHGVSLDSDLEITITEEGIIADLWENTETSLQSAECTATFGSTFEEFLELLR